ncbi:MAG: hypothetical protein M1608_03830 [Candidatus Omnitrophica bacterium]|nr:hypothetical protein [Candidatus Omnitrophota bacterium]
MQITNSNRKKTGFLGCSRHAASVRSWTLASILILCLPAIAGPAPFAHGVVFFCPPDGDSAIAELQKILADGYNLVEFASWPWTLPKPGGRLETTATAVLNWCDAHEMRFFLMHNIQYDNLDGAYANPMGAAGLLTDWLRVLKGHPCAAGVILGNEVGPTPGSPGKNPKWWAGFITELKNRHTSIQSLNTAWETHYADFAEVMPPKAGSPGRVDYDRFAVTVFDRFYGALFRQVCEPALGRLLYAPKTSGDPLLQRACESFSMICWDDALSDYPQWRVKAMGDVSRMTGKPAFNAELHLYHDTYAYFGSPAKSRYRYFLSALNGEWASASFAYGQWTKPQTLNTHQATPGILADLRRLEAPLRAFNEATPQLHVVLSGPETSNDTIMQRLYTEFANLGCSWEYVCPQDIARLTTGAVYLPENTCLPRDSCQALADLPHNVRIVFAERNALADDYGHPVPRPLLEKIVQRACHQYGVQHLIPADEEQLTTPYTESIEASYTSWSSERGHFAYLMTYPRLEARRVQYQQGWLVAVVNHATVGKPVTAKLPWSPGKDYHVRDLTAGGTQVRSDTPQDFQPLSVRLFRYSIGVPVPSNDTM